MKTSASLYTCCSYRVSQNLVMWSCNKRHCCYLRAVHRSRKVPYQCSRKNLREETIQGAVNGFRGFYSGFRNQCFSSGFAFQLILCNVPHGPTANRDLTAMLSDSQASYPGFNSMAIPSLHTPLRVLR